MHLTTPIQLLLCWQQQALSHIPFGAARTRTKVVANIP